MPLRILSAIAALVSAAGASASFDLMLIPGSDQIHRYDPVSRVSLGAYDHNGGRIIAANSSGRSYAGEVSNAQVQSYSNGQYHGNLAILNSTRSMELAGNGLFSLASTTMRKTDIVSGASTNVTLSASVNWYSLASYGNHVVATGLNGSNVISFQSIDINSLALSSVVTGNVTVIAGSILGKSAFTTNPSTPSQLPTLMIAYASTTGFLSVAKATLSSGVMSGALNSSALTGFVATNSMPSILSAHGGWWVYGQDTGGTNVRIQRQENLTGGGNAFSVNYTMAVPGGGSFSTATHYQPGMVVAPEPAAFLPLGLGLGVLLRRRRKQ